MLVIAIIVIGIVVGVLAHLVLGADGYSWLGEIVLAICGAALFGLFMGILAGARNAGFDALLTGAGTLNFGLAIQIAIAAIIGAVIADGLAIWLTFRSTGRGFR